MKYLLDTHTAIWAFDDKSKLSETARAIIGDVTVSLCVSVISALEVAIKISLDKLGFEGGSTEFLNRIRHNGIELLQIGESHLKYLETMPFIHRDPFDRLLVATAKTENMTIITADENIRKYDVLSIW